MTLEAFEDELRREIPQRFYPQQHRKVQEDILGNLKAIIENRSVITVEDLQQLSGLYSEEAKVARVANRDLKNLV